MNIIFRMSQAPKKLLISICNNYCRIANFRVIFISRIFYFRIFREVLNSRASTCAAGHSRGLKLGIFRISSERQIVVSQRSQPVVHTELRSILRTYNENH